MKLFAWGGVTILILFLNTGLQAQKLPDQMRLSPDQRRLITGDLPYTGFYDQSVLHDIYLNFPESDYWDELEDNYDDHINILASVTIDGFTYDSVGVRFKGATSYTGSNADKKSFNITLNAYIPGQDIDGYNILNLNNGYNDPSFMAEILYEYQLSKHLPAPKGNLAHLYINGMDWGVYANVQQVNRDLVEEWFPSKNGSLWRAKIPEDSPAPHGVRGDSLRTLYFLSSDTMEYWDNYDLKSAGDVTNPSYRLMNVCRVMDSVSQSNMQSILGNYLDIDRALWFLAGESIFGDDDSYILKGRSDYYIYYEIETGRLSTIEMDGNDTFDPDKFDQDIFKNANKPNWALLYKLLNNPPLRQRYLAHMRTFVNDGLDTSTIFPKIDFFRNMIDNIVQNDPVNNYTYADFVDHIDVLKNYVIDRKDHILDDSEIDVSSPSISNTISYSDTVAWKRPAANEDVYVNTTVSSSNGINKVSLYTGTGITGNFSKVLMADDGLHHDSAAGDGIYGAKINGMPGGTWIRFYIEATSNNSAKTVSYDPEGAEHDVYTYLVQPSRATDTSIVINELMAKNTVTATDSMGHHEDWIELYNNSTQATDIGGYYLTDNSFNLIKWRIPEGTIIPANDYLILWADDETDEGAYHTNFKFAGNGEELFLMNLNHELVDSISFGAQSDDISLARLPNGTGPFVNQAATFDSTNNPFVEASFSVNVNSGCAPVTVDFSNTSTAVSYSWNFGDTTSSAITNPTHTYTSPGNYSVVLIASNGIFSDTDTVVNLIQVNVASPVVFPDDTLITSGLSYPLDAGADYQTYLWSTNETTQTISADTNGYYCVTVNDTNGCVDSACTFVIVNSLGIIESSNNLFSLYPSPADDHLILHSTKSGNLKFQIFNSIGELMIEQNTNTTYTINTSRLPDGIYFIKAENNLRAFIINHR